VKFWDEECDIDPSSGERSDWFTVGSADMWGAAGSGLTVSRVIGEGPASGTKGVAVVIFLSLAGCNAVPWLDGEREPVLIIDETAEGSVVPCIELAAVSLEIGSFSRGAR